jgi:hypothetical protein
MRTTFMERAAVFAIYGWPPDMSDDAILAALLERGTGSQVGTWVLALDVADCKSG